MHNKSIFNNNNTDKQRCQKHSRIN